MANPFAPPTEQAIEFVIAMSKSDPMWEITGVGGNYKKCRYCGFVKEGHDTICPWLRAKRIAKLLMMEGHR